MSNTFGGLESSTLPDGKPSDDDFLPLDDDIEISFSDEDPSQQLAQPLRGQNENPGSASYSGDPDLGDIENPRIRDRIMRERRLREESETRALRDTEQMEQALLSSEKSKIAIQKDAFRLSLDGVDVRIRTATEALKMARADGDTNAETDIEQQVNELRQIRGNLEQQMSRLPNEQDLDRAYIDHVNARRQQAAQRPRRSDASDDGVRPLNEKAAQWARQNSWMSDRSRTIENKALLDVNNALVNEGYDANTDEFFVEMSRRMARSFPSLGVKDIGGRQLGGNPNQRRSSSPPVADARSQAPAANRNSLKSVDLDRTDRAMMRQLGIDPNDKVKVQRYAKEKFLRQRSEQRGY